MSFKLGQLVFLKTDESTARKVVGFGDDMVVLDAIPQHRRHFSADELRALTKSENLAWHQIFDLRSTINGLREDLRLSEAKLQKSERLNKQLNEEMKHIDDLKWKVQDMSAECQSARNYKRDAEINKRKAELLGSMLHLTVDKIVGNV